MGCTALARAVRVDKREEEAPVTAQDNEALVRRLFEEVWAKGNVAALDEFMAADYVEHTEHAVPQARGPGATASSSASPCTMRPSPTGRSPYMTSSAEGTGWPTVGAVVARTWANGRASLPPVS